MPDRVELLETGLYDSLPFEQYAAAPAINSGIIRWGIKATPLHMHAAREGRIANSDTDDRKHGRHIHCRILEGKAAMQERFLIATTCQAVNGRGEVCGNTAKYLSPAGDWYCGVKSHAPPGCTQPTEFVSIEESQRTERIAEVLHSHPVMKLFQRGFGKSELSCFWERFGLPLKCRIDRLAREPHRKTIIDLKKCQTGKSLTVHCEKAIADHRYDVQAAMNVDAVRELEGGEVEFFWVFIEDNEPFDVNVIPADDETLAIGWHDAQRALSLYASQYRRGDIRGAIYDPRVIRRGGLPYWFRRPYRETEVTAGDDSEQLVSFGDEPVAVPEALSVRDHERELPYNDDSDIPY